MLKNLRLFQVPASAEVEESVFALTDLLEERCDSISACDVFVTCAKADPADEARCTVRLDLQIFGEQISVTGTSSKSGDDTPLQSALASTYHDAVAALQLLARRQTVCSGNCSQRCVRGATGMAGYSSPAANSPCRR
jgi:hypothetical protein